MSGRSSRRLTVAAIGAVVLLALTLPALSPLAYVVPRGASMEPRVSSGDLAVVRAAGGYRVGDVAAYRNAMLHRVVLHRIVAVDGDSYTFKGDRNDFVDPQPVSREQLVGRLVLAVPLLGSLLLWLSSPLNALLLLALVVLVVRDRARLLAPRRGVAAAEPIGSTLDDARVIPIRDMSFPHELAVADVVRPESLLELATRYDRPLLHDVESDMLFVVDTGTLFRCQLEQPRTAAAPLAVVRDLLSDVPALHTPVVHQQERERRHGWPRRRDYGGRRKPSPQGRDWAYAHEK